MKTKFVGLACVAAVCCALAACGDDAAAAGADSGDTDTDTDADTDTDTDTDTDSDTDSDTDTDTDTDVDTDSDSDSDVVAFAIAGEYDDEWDDFHVLTQTGWSTEFLGSFALLKFDNELAFAVAQNGTDTYYPDLFSRFDWTVFDQQLYYCQTVYDASSAEEAEAAEPADASDPTSGGCGGFAWTLMVPDDLEIIGNYSDEWSDTHQISADEWQIGMLGTYLVAAYYNTSDYLIAQNGADTFGPDLWSRFDWTVYQDELYYCQTAFDAETPFAAEAIPAADASDPTTGGCGGFAWTQLILE